MDQITIVHYIRQHLFDSIRVENIAKELFMNCPHLSAKFKEAGETLTDFIWKEKTEEAKRLLRYSDKSFSSIGADLGFSSSGHFSQLFFIESPSSIRLYQILIKIHAARQAVCLDILIQSVHALHLLRAVDNRGEAYDIVADFLIISGVCRSGHDIGASRTARERLCNDVLYQSKCLSVNICGPGIIRSRQNLHLQIVFLCFFRITERLSSMP